MNYFERFKIAPRSKVKLKDMDPAFTDGHKSHESAAEEIAHYQKKLCELQDLLYAERRHSLLVCLQAVDTGGKDGVINHVLSAMNPQGCRVAAFKQPTTEELAHDFLWRAHTAAPARGEVVIFNRSHYEDVLIVRVHNLVPKPVWSRRYDRINDFEKNLLANDTQILKFFLHISKEEQLKRFKERLDDPSKHWKISEADYKERGFWDDYTAAYEEALSHCSTEHAPWFVIPANHKWFRNLAIARIVVEHLESLKMQYPKPTVDMERIRREYHAAAKDA
jgi:PPK2 family polyphosphate:nucleotide phosphotransferase